MSSKRIGIWLVGAKGGVASTAITGLLGLQKGLVEPIGLVSELPAFRHLKLVDWADFVVSGHDIRDVSLVESAERMQTVSRAIDRDLLDACREDVAVIDARIQPGTIIGVGDAIARLATDQAPARRETPSEAVRRLQADMRAFVQAESLSELIVVNVASTEPVIDLSGLPTSWAELEKWLQRATVRGTDSPAGGAEESPLPASSLYAIAALDSGFPYINFTPSLGSAAPAIEELARLRATCHAGRDGKTGETLLKSVLAPMFAHRNLQVMSWVGHNIFGNLDGKILDDPRNKRSKIASKDQLLGEILGYQPQTLVSIEYVESLGDWKTAWDHVHFLGFLGIPMTLQFTWQGCDSLLAAPLVLDLVRFTERAKRDAAQGTLDFLACFFKSPLGDREHAFEAQFSGLLQWADGL